VRTIKIMLRLLTMRPTSVMNVIIPLCISLFVAMTSCTSSFPFFNRVTSTPSITLTPTHSTTASFTPSLTPTSTYTPSPSPPFKQPPDTLTLSGFNHEYQRMNNCGPVTASIALSYFDIYKPQKVTAAYLRSTKTDDKNVPPEQIQEYIESLGLSTALRVNGSIDLVKTLLANNALVITHQMLNTKEDIAHYRVIKGYTPNQLISSDSYYNPNHKMSSSDFNKMWKPLNYRYIVVYRKKDQQTVKAILGRDWDITYNREHDLDSHLQEAEEGNDNAYTWLNIGEDYTALERFQNAVDAWEKAESMGLPARTLWYILWPFTSYNAIGEHQKVITMVNSITRNSTNKHPADLMMERAKAYWELGQQDKALKEIKNAIYWEPNYTPAKEILEQFEQALEQEKAVEREDT